MPADKGGAGVVWRTDLYIERLSASSLPSPGSPCPLTFPPDASYQFQNFQFPGSSRLLFTMDVQSLYTSILHQEGLGAHHVSLEQKPEPSPPTTTLLPLAKNIFTLNNFSFKSFHFLQVGEVAMGTHMGFSYACLFM
eukprot:g32659.t1